MCGHHALCRDWAPDLHLQRDQVRAACTAALWPASTALCRQCAATARRAMPRIAPALTGKVWPVRPSPPANHFAFSCCSWVNTNSNVTMECPGQLGRGVHNVTNDVPTYTFECGRMQVRLLLTPPAESPGRAGISIKLLAGGHVTHCGLAKPQASRVSACQPRCNREIPIRQQHLAIAPTTRPAAGQHDLPAHCAQPQRPPHRPGLLPPPGLQPLRLPEQHGSGCGQELPGWAARRGWWVVQRAAAWPKCSAMGPLLSIAGGVPGCPGVLQCLHHGNCCWFSCCSATDLLMLLPPLSST